MLVVLTCSVTGALSAAEWQVMKWDVDRSEVKVRAEKKSREASKKKNPKPQPRQGEINSLSLSFINGILQVTQLQGLNLKHIFMGS